MRLFAHVVLFSAVLFVVSACGGSVKIVSVTPTNGGLTVSWTDQGSFQGFDVRAVPAPGTPTSNGQYGISPDTTSFALTGLTNGVTYNVAVFGYGNGNQLLSTARSQGTPLGPIAYVAAGPRPAAVLAASSSSRWARTARSSPFRRHRSRRATSRSL